MYASNILSQSYEHVLCNKLDVHKSNADYEHIVCNKLHNL